MKTQERTDIINKLIFENGFKSYLEIGLGSGNNFRAVKCEFKRGCDPEYKDTNEILGATSDNFFLTLNEFHPERKYDLIFIDGLHHSDQVEKDIVNAWNCLNKGGLIVIHDIKPLNEKSQKVPREQVAWTGDVWRSWYGFKKQYPKIKTWYIEERVGLGVIEKSGHKIKIGFSDMETTYQEYDSFNGWQ